MTIHTRLNKNPLIQKVFGSIGPPKRDIFLVGGYLRDLIWSHRPPGLRPWGLRPLDMDFVVKGDIKTLVNTLSSKLKGTVVELKKEHMLRIAFKVAKGYASLDFSRLKGNIEDDLKTRDFTFNAIAWSPEQGLIDPYNGIKDIEKGIIRGILKQNFKDDPVRLLRAYRFSSEFCINIDKKTRAAIRELSGLIKYPAPERITLEFLKLLDGKCPYKALKMALTDGILTEILSLSFNALERNLKSIFKIEENLKKIGYEGLRAPMGRHRIADPLKRAWLGSLTMGSLTPIGLLRLEGLLVGSEPDKNLLCLSKAINKRVRLVSRGYEPLRKWGYKPLRKWGYEPLRQARPTAKLGLQAPYEVFCNAGDALIDLLILTGKTDFIKEAERFLKIMQKGLLSSHEIMKLTGIKEGPKLGYIINELKKLEFQMVIRNKADALRKLRLLINAPAR